MKMSSLPKAFLASDFTGKSKLIPHLFHGVAAARPAAAAGGLQNDGETELHGQFLGFLPALERLGSTGVVGTPQASAICLAESLSPIRSKILEEGPMNWMPALLAGTGKVTVLAQKAVSGVDGVGTVLFLANWMIWGISR